jgi:hypothetical protein
MMRICLNRFGEENLVSPDNSKHQRLRMLAMQLMGQLPDDPEDAYIVLKYMRELFEGFIDRPAPKPHIVLADQLAPETAPDPKNVLKFLREAIEPKTADGNGGD